MKISNKIILLIVTAFIASSVILAGCGNSSDSVSDNSAATADSAVSESQQEVYEIDTSIGKFYYPEKWKGIVTTKESDKAVSFYSEGVEVFALKLGGSEGFSVGTYKGEDLRLVTYKFDDKLEKSRFDELCAMQEDANVILNHLKNDKDYKPK